MEEEKQDPTRTAMSQCHFLISVFTPPLHQFLLEILTSDSCFLEKVLSPTVSALVIKVKIPAVYVEIRVGMVTLFHPGC